MTRLDDQLQEALTKRQRIAKLRRLVVNPDDAIDFSSNDFLGLSQSPLLRQQYLDELATLDRVLGSTGSRLLDGNSQYAVDLESQIARFHGAEMALLFNSGFDANTGLFSTVPQKGDIIVYDELVHASVHEGMRASRAGRRIPFKHSDVNDLDRVLKELRHLRNEKNVFIAVETVYSMDGDIAPLKEMIGVLRKYWPQRENGYVIVDEASKKSWIGFPKVQFSDQAVRPMPLVSMETTVEESYVKWDWKRRYLRVYTPLEKLWLAMEVNRLMTLIGLGRSISVFHIKLLFLVPVYYGNI